MDDYTARLTVHGFPRSRYARSARSLQALDPSHVTSSQLSVMVHGLQYYRTVTVMLIPPLCFRRRQQSDRLRRITTKTIPLALAREAKGWEQRAQSSEEPLRRPDLVSSSASFVVRRNSCRTRCSCSGAGSAASARAQGSREASQGDAHGTLC